MEWSYGVMRIKCLFIEFTSVKRFFSIQFLHERKMIWVNDLIADEICHKKNANAAKCGEKCIIKPFL